MMQHYIFVHGYAEPIKIDDRQEEQVRMALVGNIVPLQHLTINQDYRRLLIPLRSIVMLESRTND